MANNKLIRVTIDNPLALEEKSTTVDCDSYIVLGITRVKDYNEDYWYDTDVVIGGSVTDDEELESSIISSSLCSVIDTIATKHESLADRARHYLINELIDNSDIIDTDE